MAGLPTPLAIALWFTGAVWAVGLVAIAFDTPAEIVGSIVGFGTIAAVAEWRLRKPK
jgi:hypothetical protein